MTNNLFLVDTSAWILALGKDFFPVVKDRLKILLKENTIITSGMIKFELLGGTKSDKEFRRLKARLDALDVVDINTPMWEKAYNLAFKLRRKGITVPYTDILIAASALIVDATVVHVDSHFDLMQTHINLKVESYVGSMAA